MTLFGVVSVVVTQRAESLLRGTELPDFETCQGFLQFVDSLVTVSSLNVWTVLSPEDEAPAYVKPYAWLSSFLTSTMAVLKECREMDRDMEAAEVPVKIALLKKLRGIGISGMEEPIAEVFSKSVLEHVQRHLAGEHGPLYSACVHKLRDSLHSAPMAQFDSEIGSRMDAENVKYQGAD